MIFRILGAFFLFVGAWFAINFSYDTNPLGAESEFQVSAEVVDSHSKARLVSEKLSVLPGSRFWLALTLEPQKGWHTYWSNPGDSGSAPILKWKPVPGAVFSDIYYPPPQRMPIDPLMNYGYKDGVTLLIEMTTPEKMAQNSLKIDLDAEWLVCNIECIPQFGTFSVEIPIGEELPSAGAVKIISQALDNLPEPPLYDAEIDIADTLTKLTVFMSDKVIKTIENAYFFPREPGVVDYSAPQVINISDRGLVFSTKRFAGDPVPPEINGIISLDTTTGPKRVELVGVRVVSSGNNQETALNRSPLPAGQSSILSTSYESGITWITAAFFAFIGGIILNLMPCVFPVLSLKAFAFMKGGGQSARERRQEGWAYTAGILFCFAIIVAVLVGLRAGGSQIGWGIQFQNPVFLAVMTIIMLLLGLSMSGMFNISTGFEGAGQGLASADGNKGAFFTGVLTTLVATPCTAPFLGSAIGFAMVQPLAVMAFVFAMLGLGLAFPFLMLSYSPKLASLLPKPGAWMETLKQGLAFPLYLSAAALLWLFSNIAGTDAMLQLMGAAILIVFAIWIFQKSQKKSLKSIAVMTALIGLYFSVTSDRVAQTVSSGNGLTPASDSSAFTQQKLDAVIGGDRPVFAYFTADWCITCKVNERVALFQDETKDHFDALNVKIIKGDWTNKNTEIAGVLKRYGRAGVPLYLYFPAGSKEAVILPEILTVGLLKSRVQ